MEDYKEKYEKLYRFVNDLYPHMSDYCKEKVDGYFPELKESEDERIWTINYLNNRKLNSSIIEEKESLKRAIAWLERQGEQNPAWSEEDEPQKELAETYLAVFDEKFPILPTLNGKQLADYKNFLNKCQQILGLKYWGIRPLQAKLFEKLSLLWAAWGAEHLKGLGQTNGNTDNEKQEWSEEDDIEISVLINALGELKTYGGDFSKQKNWLKSLKERYTWKPSDEQMKALEYFVRSIGESGYASPYDNNTKLVYSLLSDLKKLK